MAFILKEQAILNNVYLQWGNQNLIKYFIGGCSFTIKIVDVLSELMDDAYLHQKIHALHRGITAHATV